MLRRVLLLTAVAVILSVPRGAGATTISATCGSCGDHNTSFDVTYSLYPGASADAQNIYQFVITATYDPNGSTAPNGFDYTYINSISFKIDAFATSDYQNGTPQVTGASEDSWNVLFGGIDAGGCDGSGGGFWCADSVGYGASHTGGAGTTDMWVFKLDLKNNLANLGATTAGTLKAEFTDKYGNKVGSLLSEQATFRQVPYRELPEPATLVLLGTGLTGAVGLSRRRRRRAS